MEELEFFDQERIEAVASALDLRDPNRLALESIVYEVGKHYVLDNGLPPFECVVDSATGAGKTYILAAAIEYFAEEATSNFAVIVPGRTILEKTVGNFTPGHPKSLLSGMLVEPVVITSDNFATAAMRAAMDDPEQVKLFIFTVQALTNPRTEVSRKTHKFQEGLGQAFYERLQQADDLIVFADEHHAYYGPAFSDAIRELRPRVLVGLTATPHKKTPEEQIIYRYPLAAAIADRVVKTPVIVGRKDDRIDPTTKLHDGIALLDLKGRAVARYCAETGATPVNPVMLVIAPKIEEAKEVESILSDPSFLGGAYAERVLRVDSSQADEALAQLARLEEPDSPYRVVVSVGMLKEGWDVKNVYVICSLRASVSDLLTEQTLGRGLRLPFGTYTGIEILDTLEVLGHERYEQLLKKADVLKERFVDWRSRAVLVRDAEGNLVPTIETTSVALPIAMTEGETAAAEVGTGKAIVTSVESYTKAAEEQVAALSVELAPRENAPTLRVPRLRMTTVASEFSLRDITDLDPFEKLGKRIAADPASELRRVRVAAKVVTGSDGLRRAELVRAPAVDKIESPATLLPLDDARNALLDHLLLAPVVPARAAEKAAAGLIIDAFLKGLGTRAAEVLSGYMDRSAAGLIDLVTREQRRYAQKPKYDEVIELIDFRPMRLGRAETSHDLAGTFKKGVGYEGYKKSMYVQDWFDSSTERAAANILDEAAEIASWVRLQTGDLPILWNSAGREYNPDFIAVAREEVHWVIEVKMDKEMQSADVKGKREAAKRWATYVSTDSSVGTTWNYLLVSESDVKTAKGSWEALRALGN
jgi:type III restriction enzyme